MSYVIDKLVNYLMWLKVGGIGRHSKFPKTEHHVVRILIFSHKYKVDYLKRSL